MAIGGNRDRNADGCRGGIGPKKGGSLAKNRVVSYVSGILPGMVEGKFSD